jgi:hypothetical protein
MCQDGDGVLDLLEVLLDADLLTSLDPEVRTDVEAAGRIFARRFGLKYPPPVYVCLCAGTSLLPVPWYLHVCVCVCVCKMCSKFPHALTLRLPLCTLISLALLPSLFSLSVRERVCPCASCKPRVFACISAVRPPLSPPLALALCVGVCVCVCARACVRVCASVSTHGP